jgi:hypothetical protein
LERLEQVIGSHNKPTGCSASRAYTLGLDEEEEEGLGLYREVMCDVSVIGTGVWRIMILAEEQ